MTVLSGKMIQKRMHVENEEERLFISPILELEEQIREDQSSVDVRLGFEFAVSTAYTAGAIDDLEQEENGSISSKWSNLYRKEYVSFGRKIVIHPHQFMLASTLEYIRQPNDIMAYVMTRSSWGRLGLIVATAVGVQPGFAGCLVLELRNLGEAPIALYPGQAVAQLFLHVVEGIEIAGVGQYSGATDLMPRRLSSGATRNKLLAFAKKFSKLTY